MGKDDMKLKLLKKITFLLIIALPTNLFSEKIFYVVQNEKENRLYITISTNGKVEVFQKYNYIPGSKDLYVKYINGSLLGFFPIENDKIKINAWNDKNHEFELAFFNSKTNKKNILAKGNGWDFHIIESKINDLYWVAIIKIGDSMVFEIDDKGIITNTVKFTSNFSPDIVKIEKQNNTEILILESLDYYCEYKLDFKKCTAIKK
jgi:hypothetical protein